MNIKALDPIAAGEVVYNNSPFIYWESHTNDSSVTFVEIVLNEKIYTTRVDANGDWYFFLPGYLAEGNHNLSIRYYDNAGNAGEIIQRLLVVDYTPPEQPEIITIIDDFGAAKGPIGNGNFTDDNKPTLKGNAEAGSVVRIYSNGQLLASVQAGNNGVWELDVALTNGVHNLYVTATDRFDQVSKPSEIYSLRVNVSPLEKPELVSFIDNEGASQGLIGYGGLTDDKTPLLIGKAPQDAANVNIYINGALAGVATVTAGQWSWTSSYPVLIDGYNIITLRAMNARGELSDETTPFLVQVEPAVVETPLIISATDNYGSVVGQLLDGSITNDFTPTLNGTAKENSLVYLFSAHISGTWNPIGSVRADKNGNWSVESRALSNGNGEYQFQASYNAVREPGATVFTLYISSIADQVPQIINAYDDFGAEHKYLSSGQTTDDATPTLNGRSAPGAVVEIQYGLSTGAWEFAETATANANGDWRFESPYLTQNGSWEYRTRNINGAKESGWSSKFVVNLGAEIPTIENAEDNVGKETGLLQSGATTDDAQPVLNGTGTPGSMIEIQYGTLTGSWINGGKVTVDANGKWSWQSPQLGDYTGWEFRARSSDGKTQTEWSSRFRLNLEAPDKSFDGYFWDFNDGSFQGWTATGKYARELAVSKKSYDVWSFTDDKSTSGYNGNVMYIKVLVQKGLTYQLEFDGDRLSSSGSAPKIGMTIDGKTIIQQTSLLRGWNHYSGEYYATETQTVTLAVTNGTATSNGNDFAVDNISFKPLPTGNYEHFSYYPAGNTDKTSFVAGKSYLFDSGVSVTLNRASLNKSDGMASGFLNLDQNAIATIELPDNAKSISLKIDYVHKPGNVVEFYDARGFLLQTKPLDYASSINNSVEINYDAPAGQLIGSVIIRVSPNETTVSGNYGGLRLEEVSWKTLTNNSLNAAEDGHININAHDAYIELSHLLASQDSVKSVNLIDNSANTLKVDLNSLLMHGEKNLFIDDGKTQMMINGDNTDTVQFEKLLIDGLENNAVQQKGSITVGGVAYQVFSYSASDAELLVQHGIKTEFI